MLRKQSDTPAKWPGCRNSTLRYWLVPEPVVDGAGAGFGAVASGGPGFRGVAEPVVAAGGDGEVLLAVVSLT